MFRSCCHPTVENTACDRGSKLLDILFVNLVGSRKELISPDLIHDLFPTCHHLFAAMRYPPPPRFPLDREAVSQSTSGARLWARKEGTFIPSRADGEGGEKLRETVARRKGLGDQPRRALKKKNPAAMVKTCWKGTWREDKSLPVAREKFVESGGGSNIRTSSNISDGRPRAQSIATTAATTTSTPPLPPRAFRPEKDPPQRRTPSHNIAPRPPKARKPASMFSWLVPPTNEEILQQLPPGGPPLCRQR